MTRALILVAEDREPTRRGIGRALRRAGYDVVAAPDGAGALARFEREPVDCVVSDQCMPRMDGLGLLRATRRIRSVPFILYSAAPDPDVVFRAGAAGAVHFLEYPFDVGEHLVPAIERGLEAGALRTLGADRFLGTSPEAVRTREQIRRLGPTPLSVLIAGETGSGKEVVARALHEESGRNPLRTFAVTDLAEGLLEAELFGHERGAFTGANRARAGLFEQADGGSLLLDEIGDAPSALQAKLLRVLEQREVRRVGGDELRRVDVRVLAATHRDLRAAVAAGRFREDLFYRLHQARIDVSPLRDRPGDIQELTRACLAEIGAGAATAPVRCDDAAIALLRGQPWPGNVRELRSLLHVAALAGGRRAGSSPVLTSADLLEAMFQLDPTLSAEERAIRAAMLDAWRRADGNQERARRILGMTRAAWRHRWTRHGMARLLRGAR